MQPLSLSGSIINLLPSLWMSTASRAAHQATLRLKVGFPVAGGWKNEANFKGARMDG